MHPRLIFILFALAGVARATTVEPPSFPELVNEADAIYRGRVTAVQARHVDRSDGGGVILKTFVTVVIDRVLKGATQKEIVLEFLGGTLGEDSLEISGMPKFSVGDREIFFVQRNGVQFCPLVALTHGRYRVLRDEAGARDYIARDNRLPLNDPSEVELPLHRLPAALGASTASTSRALTPAAFEALIAAEVIQPTLRVQTK